MKLIKSIPLVKNTNMELDLTGGDKSVIVLTSDLLTRRYLGAYHTSSIRLKRDGTESHDSSTKNRLIISNTTSRPE